MDKYTKQELIGQKLLVGFEGKEIDNYVVDLIQKYKVGGFILYRRNYDTYSEFITIIKKLKELNRVNRIPLLICVDQENGIVNRLPDEFHRIKNALASSKCNNDVLKEVGDITAEILYKSGVNVNLAPTVDIYDDKISKSIGNRCFGRTSDDVIKNTRIIIEEHKKNNVIPFIKHFPGLRKIKVDTHILLPRIKHIDEEDLKPFITHINENVPGILVGHILVKDLDKLPVSLSRKTNSLIKDTYNYKGITMTDDIKMRSVRYRYGRIKAAKLALKSGNDIIMFNYPHNKEIRVINEFNKLYDLYSSDINESAMRIIKLKESFKINDNDFKELSLDEINKYNERIDKVNSIIIKENK
ncbi:MAG: glycoside hydrolase family 3 protein [Bacilli bacterium]|nr:glycoside hydrolase family 3 protein [Bacilli bacterium]